LVREEVQPHESLAARLPAQPLPGHPDIDDLVQETYARLLQAREAHPVHSPALVLSPRRATPPSISSAAGRWWRLTA